MYFYIVDLLSNFGILYSKICFYEKVIQYYERVLEMRKKFFFEDYGLIVDFYNNFVLVYKFVGQFEKVKECF